MARQGIQSARQEVAVILQQAQLDIDTAFLQAQLLVPAELPPKTPAAVEGPRRLVVSDGRNLTFEETVESHDQLDQALRQLDKEHRDLQAKYKAEKDDWNKFRAWWHSVVAKKRASQGGTETGERQQAEGGPSEGPVLTKAKKRKLSQEEQDLFNRLDMECDVTQTSTKAQSPVAVRRASDIKRDSKEKEKEEKVDDKASLSASRSSDEEQDRNNPNELHGQALKETARSNSQDQKSSASDERETTAVVRQLSSAQHGYYKVDRLRRMEELKKDPLKYKGRGRYSNGTKEHGEEGNHTRSINDEYEIDPEKNGGVDFPHKAVVRDKAQRKGMHAFDCECCRDYYEAVGPPPETTALGDPVHETSEQREARMQEHRQQLSRHRAYGPPELTPPGYWDIGFPTTQKQKQLNQLAEEEHERKRRQMATDPRYRKRQQP
ncbi:hypothetical protein FA10DRAFT_263568 [Acaromyces ingoldii]|uniref:DNA endonuclease activator Ctp1 C-terminal domain-containing protein n=1 Tax=Acaromyces ingoldii TaxID=215250 RepID=A0A316YXK9_9BASI|nr:hypothetical protein FA10DRAFT_263568 [Acaromyces ingoldii]PWN92813.1 hypothetical protein FA10DRAFT_263568 [Acaromyces ingoldii]